jgi:hypothetical protein
MPPASGRLSIRDDDRPLRVAAIGERGRNIIGRTHFCVPENLPCEDSGTIAGHGERGREVVRQRPGVRS